MSAAPNILYLMFDQAKASAMSFLGNKDIALPYCDSLADSGWVFENAYSAAPICTPSRTSVHTGTYPQVHGVTCHQNRAPHNLPQLAEILRESGYYTAAAGHYEPERNLGRGWHEQSPMHERGPLMESWQAHIRSGRKDVAWSSGAIDREAREGNSALLTDRVIRMARQAKASSLPYFLHVCYDDPHPPYFVPRPYDTMLDPDEIDIPAIGDLADLPAWHSEARAQVGTAAGTEADFRKVLAIYYGMIRYVDDEMARLHRFLETQGMLENTWIILGSDHGDYACEKGLFNKSESLYRCLLHVPLVIVPPKSDVEPAANRFQGLVSTIDLFPTILGMAGVKPPRNQGRDLMNRVRAADDQFHNEVFAGVGDYHGHLETSWPSGMPAAGRHASMTHAIRTSERTYIIDPDNGDEAYDLRSDPYELRNLTNAGLPPLDGGFESLKAKLERFIDNCASLRAELGIVDGDRGFVRGWE